MDRLIQALSEITKNASFGGIGTGFGGLLVYAYIPPTTAPSAPCVGDLETGVFNSLNELIKDEKLVEELLSEAVKKYPSKLNDKLLRAQAELTSELLSPLYNAAGFPAQSWTEILYEHIDYRGTRGKRTLVKKEVSNGVTTSRVMKTMGTGRPHEWTHTKLKTAVTKAANKVRKSKKNGEPNLSETAEQLNLRYAGKKSFTEDSLRMLLKAYAVDWKEIKKRR